MHAYQHWRRRGDSNPEARAGGFTLVELLTVIAVIAILASLLLPALAGAKGKAYGVACLSNQRQLALSCLMYAMDYSEALPYNLGAAEIKRLEAQNQFWNWTTPVMSWELDPDNTNSVAVTAGGVGPYTSRSSRLYRCPSDSVVSDLQAAAGWRARVRSISMNAMVGNAGAFLLAGANVNNPEYRQFLKVVEIPQPSRIFLLIEEHPDSINDAYFLNKPDSGQWTDLPASYHNGAANLSFADGHLEAHRWLCSSTKPPSQPDAAHLPFPVPSTQWADFAWLMDRTTVDASRPAYSTGY